MNTEKSLKFFLDFISEAKTPCHARALAERELIAAGFTELTDISAKMKPDGRYFVVSGGTLIAFINRKAPFRIVSSHTDQPCFKVKCQDSSGGYIRLLTEKYGGMIYHTWLDRPLLIAGKVIVREAQGVLAERLITLDKRVVIPSVAIHLWRSQNESLTLDPKCDMLPLASLFKDTDLEALIAEKCGVDKSDIVSCDLSLVSAEKPMLAGFSEELILAPRIDDLECVASSLLAFISSCDINESVTPVYAIFDNEEIGSDTKDGAASNLLRDVLTLIAGSELELMKLARKSLNVSADNAHAKHPNHPELSDSAFAPTLGGGVVIKHNASHKYATDAVSEALFSELCSYRKVELQHYYNRADLPGGSTLGSIASTKVPMPTVDVGAPQLAMHSILETASVEDFYSMINAFEAVYSENVTLKCK